MNARKTNLFDESIIGRQDNVRDMLRVLFPLPTNSCAMSKARYNCICYS